MLLCSVFQVCRQLEFLFVLQEPFISRIGKSRLTLIMSTRTIAVVTGAVWLVKRNERHLC